MNHSDASNGGETKLKTSAPNFRNDDVSSGTEARSNERDALRLVVVAVPVCYQLNSMLSLKMVSTLHHCFRLPADSIIPLKLSGTISSWDRATAGTTN